MGIKFEHGAIMQRHVQQRRVVFDIQPLYKSLRRSLRLEHQVLIALNENSILTELLSRPCGCGDRAAP